MYLILTFVNCQILYCTTYSNLVKNFADLGFKSHVQHTISLIQHKICATAQVGFSCLQEIDQTARCGNADFNTFRKSSNVYLKKSLKYSWSINPTIITNYYTCSGRGLRTTALFTFYQHPMTLCNLH